MSLDSADRAPFRRQVDDDLELRVFEESEAEVLFQLVDANRAHLREWLPWVDGIVSIEDDRAFIQRSRAQFQRDGRFQAGICERGALVGVIGYHEIDRAHRTTEIGYWLAAEAQGRGLMTRSVRALVSYAIDELGLNRVEIRCATGNARSAAIPERLGFRLEGTLREAEWLYDHYVDHHLFAILASEWRALEAVRARA